MKSAILKNILGATFIAAALPASAGVITFDEFPRDNFAQGALQANRYAFLGVTFTGTDDGSSWDGLAAGDPGNWGVDGTNGEAFSGFNGSSYNTTISFASTVTNVLLDVSRTNGSSNGNTFTFQGFKGITLVDTQTITLGAINSWTTVLSNVAGGYDSIVMSGNGNGFHPFGVDNIRWEAAQRVPEPATLALLGLGLAGLGFSRRKQ